MNLFKEQFYKQVFHPKLRAKYDVYSDYNGKIMQQFLCFPTKNSLLIWYSTHGKHIIIENKVH